MKSKCLSNYELHTVLLRGGRQSRRAARLEAVLGCQLLVLGPEGVHPVDHLLDQLHLGVAQAVLVRDVVGHAYTTNTMMNNVYFDYFNFVFLSYKYSNERLYCAVCDHFTYFTVKPKFYEKAMTKGDLCTISRLAHQLGNSFQVTSQKTLTTAMKMKHMPTVLKKQGFGSALFKCGSGIYSNESGSRVLMNRNWKKLYS